MHRKSIIIITDPRNTRSWEVELARTIRKVCGSVVIQHETSSAPQDRSVDLALLVEALLKGRSSASRENIAATERGSSADLFVDLAGQHRDRAAPVLTLRICGAPSLCEGLRRLRGGSQPVTVTAHLDGRTVGIARPAISDRTWLSRDCDAVLGAAIALIVQSVAHFEAGTLAPIESAPQNDAPTDFWSAYLRGLFAGISRRALGKLGRRQRPFYWRTAYRTVDGPDVADTCRLDGPGFVELDDDGERFFADPFLISTADQTFLFVEEFPYALGRGRIAVAQQQADGRFSPPRPVLEEPHHLSYPQVFRHGGDYFMVPESGASNQLVLYRATDFPDQWTRDTVLIDGTNINDATLLDLGDTLWLFGTGRYGRGGVSDALVVYRADHLRGPWEPHPLNPILIDCTGARPGGHFIRKDGRVFLPVQDASEIYGGGLGIREVLHLGMDKVSLGPVQPIRPGPAWDRRGIHTLNRAGSVEVVDSTR